MTKHPYTIGCLCDDCERANYIADKIRDEQKDRRLDESRGETYTLDRDRFNEDDFRLDR
jgi:hypothetical protein